MKVDISFSFNVYTLFYLLYVFIKLWCPYAEACYTYRSQAAIHTTVMHITDPPVLLQSPHTGHDVIYTPCTLNLILITLYP
ncbi:hypothetical protein ANN_04329 [Periplaneta americana]|uniref:Secreted protein n=1 Tax=Periplaneta americana TaxID=6978 RepID=A0ABQ8T8A2_PERAM|nr:hypothetical protein ANN_04329 [Periplaneta americana]